MRKVNIFITSLFLFQFCSAQEIRELDWQKFLQSTQNTLIAKPVKTGDFAIFQIKDINKFLYKVEVAGKVFELQTPVPTELQTLFRLSPPELDKKTNTNKAEEAVKKTKSQIFSMTGAKTETEAIRKLAETNVIAALGPGVAIPDEKAKALKAIDEAIKSFDQLLKSCQKYLAKSNELSENIFKIKSARRRLIIIAQMDRPSKEIKDKAKEVTIPPIDDVRSLYFEVKQLYLQAEASYTQVKQKISDANSKAKKAGVDEVDEEIVEKVEDASEEIEEADKLIDEEALLGMIEEIDFLYNELQNDNNFNVVAPPVQMDGDIVSYTVNVTPTVTKTIGSNRSPMQFKFDIPAKNGLKVDFSVGPAFSFGKNSRDDKYFLKDVSNSTDLVNIQKEDNGNVISPGIVAMMHAYKRSGNSWALGGMFGVGAGFQSVSDVNLSVYLGPSLVIGKREKVMVSAGWSWLRVQRIKSKQFIADDPSATYKKTEIKIEDVTEKIFKTSFFFSVSYNLTNKVEVK